MHIARQRAVPTILVAAGFRFFFYSNERTEPPHVHVERMHPHPAGGSAKFWLEPPSLAASTLPRHDLRRVTALVQEHATQFKERWNEHFAAR
jgi:hypothetical protein